MIFQRGHAFSFPSAAGSWLSRFLAGPSQDRPKAADTASDMEEIPSEEYDMVSGTARTGRMHKRKAAWLSMTAPRPINSATPIPRSAVPEKLFTSGQTSKHSGHSMSGPDPRRRALCMAHEAWLLKPHPQHILYIICEKHPAIRYFPDKRLGGRVIPPKNLDFRCYPLVILILAAYACSIMLGSNTAARWTAHFADEAPRAKQVAPEQKCDGPCRRCSLSSDERLPRISILLSFANKSAAMGS